MMCSCGMLESASTHYVLMWHAGVSQYTLCAHQACWSQPVHIMCSCGMLESASTHYVLMWHAGVSQYTLCAHVACWSQPVHIMCSCGMFCTSLQRRHRNSRVLMMHGQAAMVIYMHHLEFIKEEYSTFYSVKSLFWLAVFLAGSFSELNRFKDFSYLPFFVKFNVNFF